MAPNAPDERRPTGMEPRIRVEPELWAVRSTGLLGGSTSLRRISFSQMLSIQRHDDSHAKDIDIHRVFCSKIKSNESSAAYQGAFKHVLYIACQSPVIVTRYLGTGSRAIDLNDVENIGVILNRVSD
jgi:hypothetical protein